MLKFNSSTVVFISVVTLTILGYIALLKYNYLDFLIVWGGDNIILYVTLLILIKIIGVVWPPLPGGILTLGSIPIIGWKLALLSDFVGGFTGALIAYYLGYKYGNKVLKYIFHEKASEYLSKINLKSKNELELVIVSRIVFSYISEFVSYLSGVLKLSFKKFILGIFFSHLLTVPSFYFAENIYKGQNIYLSVIFFIMIVFLLYKFRGRYFE